MDEMKSNVRAEPGGWRFAAVAELKMPTTWSASSPPPREP